MSNLWKCSGGIFDLDTAKKRIAELAGLTADENLWKDKEKAQKLLQEQTKLKNIVVSFEKLENGLRDNIDLIELGESENDESIIKESMTALKDIQKNAKRLEIQGMFSGEADANDCFIEIHPGAGGTESCDWASMLERMYLRWAESAGFKSELVEEQAGDEAGIKSATIKVSGINAYGWAKTESGVHRLVRISPFDSNSRRHTSFASIWVYPIVDDNIEIEILDKDLRVDTFRASGAGGQHVNKTDSAIRITHIPTNIVVQCQNSRSQHQNRAEAMKMLRSRLYEQEIQKREVAAEKAQASKTDIGWGNQIRSYVLHPYQMVKDLRTGVETSNTTAVLDGDLEQFMSAALLERATSKRK